MTISYGENEYHNEHYTGRNGNNTSVEGENSYGYTTGHGPGPVFNMCVNT
jgi:hypothetical protein